MRDGSDGAALLAVVHYYCPEHMRLDGECRARPRGAGRADGREGTGPFRAPGTRAPGGNVEGDALAPRLRLTRWRSGTPRCWGDALGICDRCSLSLRMAKALSVLR